MISVFCGDDVSASRKAFLTAQEKLKYDGYTLTFVSSSSDQTDLLSTPSPLFSAKEAYIAENAIKAASFRTSCARLAAAQIPLLVWEGSLLQRDVKRYLPQAHVEAFSLPVSVWRFLDGLHPGNARSLLTYSHALRESTDGHIVLFLMQQRAKDLLLTRYNVTGKRKLQAWQQRTLAGQASRWSLDHLHNFQKKLFDVEFATKSGTHPYSMFDTIDIIISFYLQ